jgi:hypothetical protein
LSKPGTKQISTTIKPHPPPAIATQILAQDWRSDRLRQAPQQASNKPKAASATLNQRIPISDAWANAKATQQKPATPQSGNLLGVGSSLAMEALIFALLIRHYPFTVELPKLKYMPGLVLCCRGNVHAIGPGK